MISLSAGLFLLLIISYAFDAAIGRYNRLNRHHPFTPFYLIVGILYTLVIVYMVDGFDSSVRWCGGEIGWLRWEHVMEAFAASGIPMVWGSLSRWTRENSHKGTK